MFGGSFAFGVAATHVKRSRPVGQHVQPLHKSATLACLSLATAAGLVTLVSVVTACCDTALHTGGRVVEDADRWPTWLPAVDHAHLAQAA